MIRKKAVVLVLSHDKDPWRSIELQGQRATWVQDKPDGVEVLFYYGGKNAVEGDRLYFPISEGSENIGRKTLAAFKYVESHYDYDFIFRTNTSSYVDLNSYLSFLGTLGDPSGAIYSGVLCKPPLGDARHQFASGAGYTLSKEMVRIILSLEDRWDHTLPDDMALAKIPMLLGIPIHEAPRLDVCDLEEAKDILTPLKISQNFHVRCKCDQNRELDIVLMKYVRQVYTDILACC